MSEPLMNCEGNSQGVRDPHRISSPVEVGQRRRWANNPRREFVVAHVGTHMTFYEYDDGLGYSRRTDSMECDSEVVKPKVKRSLPDRWVNVNAYGVGQSYPTAHKADANSGCYRLARVNLRTQEVVWCAGGVILSDDEVEVV